MELKLSPITDTNLYDELRKGLKDELCEKALVEDCKVDLYICSEFLGAGPYPSPHIPDWPDSNNLIHSPSIKPGRELLGAKIV